LHNFHQQSKIRLMQEQKWVFTMTTNPQEARRP
jgi:hypothetical protein